MLIQSELENDVASYTDKLAEAVTLQRRAEEDLRLTTEFVKSCTRQVEDAKQRLRLEAEVACQ